MSDLSKPIFHDENLARVFLEKQRWPRGPVCPFCGQFETVVTLKGKSYKPGWYHCKDCRKKFTVRVGTLYERSHVPLHKWLLATHLLCSSKKGISAHQLHRMIGVTYKTAWFMFHRIREGMTDNSPIPLGRTGKVVEADETFIGPPLIKRGRDRKRNTGPKYKVMSLVERGGKVRSIKVDTLTSRSVREVLLKNVSRKSILSTDEASYYRAVGNVFAEHVTVNHSKEEWVKGLASTNTLEGYYSIFKRGMKGTYQHCGEKHLQRYVTEFDFRYNNRIARGVDDEARTVKALKGIEGKRLTYRRTDFGPTLEG